MRRMSRGFQAVRAAIGPNIALTIDANGGLETTTRALACLTELADCNLALVPRANPLPAP